MPDFSMLGAVPIVADVATGVRIDVKADGAVAEGMKDSSKVEKAVGGASKTGSSSSTICYHDNSRK